MSEHIVYCVEKFPRVMSAEEECDFVYSSETMHAWYSWQPEGTEWSRRAGVYGGLKSCGKETL